MGQAISYIFGDGKGGRDENSYQETKRRVAVEGRRGSDGTQQNILKNLRSELESSSKTWISTCSSKLEDSSRIRVVAATCGSGGTQQNILKISLQFELEPSSNIRPCTCSSKVEDSSKITVVEESGGSGGSQQNILRSSQSELESSSNIRPFTSSANVGGETQQNASMRSIPNASIRSVGETQQKVYTSIRSIPNASIRSIPNASILNSNTTRPTSRGSGQTMTGYVDVNSSRVNEVEEGIKEKINTISGAVLKKDKWIKHYCSSHKILLVGEGDFSFSTCLAKTFGSALNMVATSLDSIEFLARNYTNAISNINELERRGCIVIHDFDATKMATEFSIKGIRFDRIIYNFPLAGFFPGEARQAKLRPNQNLVRLFFKNAKNMITMNGEIHISHKSNYGFYRDWDLETLASECGLELIEDVVFELSDYPGYHTKYGFGSDKDFDCNPSRTYKFKLQH